MFSWFLQNTLKEDGWIDRQLTGGHKILNIYCVMTRLVFLLTEI